MPSNATTAIPAMSESLPLISPGYALLSHASLTISVARARSNGQVVRTVMAG
jgi:hypothetical protein